MKQQTFLVCLQNEKNITIEFERFTDKKLETVIRKYKDFMRKMIQYSWFMNDVKNAKQLNIYKTDYEASPEKLVYNISFNDFLNSLKQDS